MQVREVLPALVDQGVLPVEIDDAGQIELLAAAHEGLKRPADPFGLSRA